MNISQIKFGIKMPIMQFANETIEVTVDVLQGEDANMAIETARKLCFENHRAANPHLFTDQEVKVSDLANAIETKKEIEFYDKLIKNIKSNKLQEAYQNKLTELSK
jgi:hypothetical protein